MDMLQWFDNAMPNAEDRQLHGSQDTPLTGENTCLEALLNREYGGNKLIDIIRELDLSLNRAHSTIRDHDHLNYNKQ
jgi:hypothetical protein